MRWHISLTSVGALLALAVCVRAADVPAEGVEFFERKIRPLLIDNCYKCHGGDKKKGNLQLSGRGTILKGGDTGPAIVPGQPEKSLLIKAVRYDDAELRMPPKSKLTDSQIADLTTWVRMGAPWPEQSNASSRRGSAEAFNLQERRKHWAWQPVKTHPQPAVQAAGWPQSPIDYFVLAQLEANHLAPAPPADKRVLLRRVTYDLLGLPPTPAEIDAILSDTSQDAFAKVVDRLLASEHYGERWARHWLDLVRYAETCGHEYDYELPDAYVYRDYVIRALNADLPYDQFVREHIAGDLMRQPRRHPIESFNESILGTGFWFLGEAAHSPVDVRADEADRIDNQIDVFAKTFLGLTVSCARCHDHKFDAITTKDYYALAGYLESSRCQRAFIDAPDRTREVIRTLQELRERCRNLAVPLAAGQMQAQAANLAHKLLSGRAGTLKDVPIHHPLYPWNILSAPERTRSDQSFAVRRQNLVQLLKSQAASAAGSASRYQEFDAFTGHSHCGWFVSGEAFKVDDAQQFGVVLDPEKTRLVSQILGLGGIHSGLVSKNLRGVLRSETFILNKKKILYHVAGKQAQIRLIIDGYQHIQDPIYGGLKFGIDHGDSFAWRVQDVSMWLGQRAYIEIIDDGPGYVAVDRILFSDDGPPIDSPNQLLVRMLVDPKVTSAEVLARKYQELFLELIEQWRSGSLNSTSDCAERVSLLNFMLESELFAPSTGDAQMQDVNRKALAGLWSAFQRAEAALSTPRRAMAMEDGTAWNEPVHIRGNHKILGPEVPRRLLEALDGERQPPPRRGSGRMILARQMTDPSNPLLARVLVNRIWQHHFGEGIVRSVDNFGVLGERPTHPELLDYLAVDFVKNGWSIKKLHRLLLLSSTYQMASRSEEEIETKDPQNRLLHRMPIRRLEAETIRDAILAVSGRLDGKQFGPSVMPYLTPHMAGRGRPGSSGPLDGDGRRSIYVGVRRNFLTPLFLAFDYPIPFTTIGRRSVSNVPAQALALMNNPFVVQQADLWARCVLADPTASSEQRIGRMYVRAFARPASETELAEAREFLLEQSKNYGRADDPLAWRDLAHILFNVKEFIFLN